MGTASARPFKAVVAVCDDWGIGHEGKLLVGNRADMRHFVEITRGQVVIMGRATLESLPGGRPLKDRRNIVLSRDPGLKVEGAEVVHTVDELLRAVEGERRTLWVIGGASVYRLLLERCHEVHVTKNHCVRPADSHFPDLDALGTWKVAERLGAGETDEGVAYEFLRYVQGSEPADELAHP